jgi:hypothetical protein
MGLATRNPVGAVRLVLSATAASAVLYGAIVLFGVGSASPSTLDTGGSDRHASVVLTRSHVVIVSGSVQKLPQASPEPGRNRLRVRPPRPRPAVVEATRPAAPVAVENKPAPVPTRGTESGPPSADSPPADPVAVPLQVQVPVPVPVPSVAIPAVPALALPLPLPALPPLPLPPLPPLQLPLDLPG